MNGVLLTIAIVCKDANIALSETLTSIQASIGKDNYQLVQVVVGYSIYSEESLSLDESIYDFKIKVVFLDDKSIYSAMNMIQDNLTGVYSVYINCGDVVLDGFRSVLHIIKRDYIVEGQKYAYILNTYHSDISSYKNGLYVGRFSPRWYSVLFGMSSEHCGWIIQSEKYRNGKFDENLKFCADYKRMYQVIASGVVIRDLRKLPCAIAPLRYGFSSQHTGMSGYLEECRVLLSLDIRKTKKIVGLCYRFLRIIISVVVMMGKGVRRRES